MGVGLKEKTLESHQGLLHWVQKERRETMKLLKRQQDLLSSYFQAFGDNASEIYDDMPSSLRASLEKVNNQETLWCDAERFISDLKVKRMIERRGRF